MPLYAGFGIIGADHGPQPGASLHTGLSICGASHDPSISVSLWKRAKNRTRSEMFRIICNNTNQQVEQLPDQESLGIQIPTSHLAFVLMCLEFLSVEFHPNLYEDKRKIINFICSMIDYHQVLLLLRQESYNSFTIEKST